ncbi:MAG: hypothetical protein J7K26_02055 [Candidatus Aenigmarchaeota archaeon]|nr:hypothetical protein [Candidatus Aenigmarchaeota archaeon]
MKKLIIGTIILGLILTTGIGTAIMTSYGSITGYATIKQSIILDIMGTSNDTYYSISGYQGETLFSPKIKLDNKAKIPITVNISIENIGNNSSDVNTTITDDTKNNTIGNIIEIPVDDVYIYIKHQFYPNSSIGNYTFRINISPI